MLTQFLAVALTFPCVVYTVLLGVALVYWVFVMIGAAHVDLLGDGAADGALDGIDGGGHADPGLHLEGADGPGLHLDGADGHGADGHGADGGHAHHGALSGILSSLKLRSAPATVVLSVLVLFAWLFSVLGMQAANAAFADVGSLVRTAVLVLAPIVALPFTSLAVRPLAHVFVAPAVAARQDLVGKICTVRTGTVTDRFGEALVEDGGAGLVVRVRVDTGETLARGAQAVIVAYDPDRQEFTVAPMDGLLDDEPARRQAEAEGRRERH
jgi:hypothetical protein